MPLVSRRAFLGTLAAAIPAATFVRHAHAAAVRGLGTSTGALHALAESVLPSELGRAETARVVGDFQRWLAGYREGVELLHGYGTSRLERAGPTPATRWMTQLDALDAAARRRIGRHASFASLGIAERRQLVQRALDDIKATSPATVVSGKRTVWAITVSKTLSGNASKILSKTSRLCRVFLSYIVAKIPMSRSEGLRLSRTTAITTIL